MGANNVPKTMSSDTPQSFSSKVIMTPFSPTILDRYSAMEVEASMTSTKMMNQDLVQIDQFDAANFSRWQNKMMFFMTTLKLFYLLDPILETLPEPTDKDSKN